MVMMEIAEYLNSRQDLIDQPNPEKIVINWWTILRSEGEDENG